MYLNKILKNIRALEYNKGRRNRNQSAFSFRSQNFNNKVRNKNIFLWNSNSKNNKQEGNFSPGFIKTFSKLRITKVNNQERNKKKNFLVGKHKSNNSMIFSNNLSPSKNQIIFNKKKSKSNSTLLSTNISNIETNNNSLINYKDIGTSRIKLSISSIDRMNDEDITKEKNDEIKNEEEIHFRFVELFQKTKKFYAKIEQQRKDDKTGKISSRNNYYMI